MESIEPIQNLIPNPFPKAFLLSDTNYQNGVGKHCVFEKWLWDMKNLIKNNNAIIVSVGDIVEE